MDADYGAAYATLYREHWWWRAREEFLTRLLERRLRDVPAGDVLDFGCGDGLFFPVLQRFGEVYGIEPDGALLDPAGPFRSRIDTRPLTTDAAEAGRYRLILALDVLEHIAEPRPIVEELTRRLKPGGLFVATVPAFMSMWTTHDVVNHHVRRYTRAELEALAAVGGLEIIDSRYFFAWLALPKLLVALAERVLPPTPKPARLPAAPINATALFVSRAEQRILASVRPPFGSSALVVARKRP